MKEFDIDGAAIESLAASLARPATMDRHPVPLAGSKHPGAATALQRRFAKAPALTQKTAD